MGLKVSLVAKAGAGAGVGVGGVLASEIHPAGMAIPDGRKPPLKRMVLK